MFSDYVDTVERKVGMMTGNLTLAKIESLAQLYQTGYRSNTVDSTIDKLVDMEQSRLEQEVASLKEKLRIFEERYQLTSVDFYGRFQAGEMGDDADWFEWSAFYRMWQSALEQLESLRTQVA